MSAAAAACGLVMVVASDFEVGAVEGGGIVVEEVGGEEGRRAGGGGCARVGGRGL